VTDWRAVRRLVPEVLGALVRRYGHFDACEDAVQEALLAAAAQAAGARRPTGLHPLGQTPICDA
jgi:DNA-directed RNA polymerase specialized sigma24 family protein